MSVNGTEIKAGQVWRCADGLFRAVLGDKYLLPDESHPQQFVISGGFLVDENGRNTSDQKAPQVLVSLEFQGTPFCRYSGTENPAPGVAVAVYFRSGVVAVGPSELFDWSTRLVRRQGCPGDVCYYSVRVNTEPVAKAAPWYPDDSGKWVEVPPGVGNLPDGLPPETVVLALSGGERTRQRIWDTALLPAHRFNWSVIVAYKVVELDTEKSAENREPAKTPGVTAPQLLEKAASHMRDRAATYDRPEGERSMAKTVAAFNAITGRDLTETEGWLLIQVLKDVRLFQHPGYHADSAEDGIAYSALKAESKSKESN